MHFLEHFFIGLEQGSKAAKGASKDIDEDADGVPADGASAADAKETVRGRAASSAAKVICLI